MISLTDLIEAYGMIKTGSEVELSTTEALVMLSFVIKDLLIVGGIIWLITWFKQRKDKV